MAPARLSADAEPPGLVPDVADDLADMLRRGRRLGGTVVVSVEFRLSDGRRVSAELPAPPPTGDETEAEGHREQVLTFLRGLRGEWAKGRTIAAEIDLDYDGGAFKNLLAGMVRAGLLESSKSNGYKIKKHNEVT